MKGASILVTGGTGSFGQAFVRRLLADHAPKRLVVFSRDEQKQEQMARTFAAPCMRYFIGDVRDQQRLEMAMRDIEIVVHAAAMKIIPTCEYDPIECVRTNVEGAENVVRAALRSGSIQKVVALSTDKACNPVNLYGATKLAQEKIMVAANNLVGSGAVRFTAVRYGNVAGSRGSVIPLFMRLALEGKSLPVTDPTMTRFSLTLDQAVDLVLYALAQMSGREIFVPRIPSFRIMDLVEAITPGEQARIIGIRPGEKLHETLITRDEARLTRDAGPCYVIDGAGDVPADFVYSSDRNDKWLSVDDLRDLARTL